MMSNETDYHRARERQCREMADKAANSDIRRIHEELAALHHVDDEESSKDAPPPDQRREATCSAAAVESRP